MIKPSLSYSKLILLLAIYFGLGLNIPLYKELYYLTRNQAVIHWGFLVSIPIFVISALNLLFQLFAWPKITKPFFALLLLLSSIISYASFQYRTIFDSEMLRNLMQTYSGEAFAYISMSSIVWIIAFGIFPTLVLFMTHIKPINNLWVFIKHKLLSMGASALLVIIISGFFYQDYVSLGRNHSEVRRLIIPTHFVYSANKYIKQTYFSPPMVYREIGTDAKQTDKALARAKEKPSLVILVVGETARAQNYQFNGYHKATNPFTSQQDVIFYPNVSSCGTATAISVPCMFSALNRDNYSHDIANNQDNVLDVLKRANIDILWKDNDGGDKGVARHVTYQEIKPNVNNLNCNGSSCFDMALLGNLDKEIDNMQGNRLVVLHLIGSHGPTYYQRYPKSHEIFTPVCARADIEKCTREEITNTYDNTIAYTDYVISQLINQLKAKGSSYNTALLYLSDHGESLGEHGLYLHGMPYQLAPRYQTEIPMMLWLSQSFSMENNLDPNCLEEQAKLYHYSHDNLFHSLLGLFSVRSEVYNKRQDIFAQCQNRLPIDYNKLQQSDSL
ncbi:phosphoethanolamine transferase [Photobacterium damselae]|uniref:phosphoethanolamine transferase n=1 Tax=Photobacterium damselae TaxID=38293 RepID=UPI001EEF28C8|nr:phosphoethanolamine--lipid A transferase [Photobacterium damselae]UKA31112.1 phosphoethanolamine--lipid A transferase [Photobacterium damselae subsp. damselae]